MPEYKKGGGDKQEAFDPKTGEYVKEGEGENNPPKINLVYPTNKIKCIDHTNTTTKRDEANDICEKAIWENKMAKEPKTYEEALETFWKSCEVEHEPQKDGRYDFDEEKVQPYIQKYIIPKMLKKFWETGRKVSIIYNPYNEKDILGCDYIMFGVGADDGELSNANPKLKIDYIDYKSNLSAIDPKNNNISKGMKLNLKHININDMKDSGRGFFTSKTKITDRYMFSVLRSDRVTDGELKSYEEIDSSNTWNFSKDLICQILKNRCGYDKNLSVPEFLNDLYKNKCKALGYAVITAIRKRQVSPEAVANNITIEFDKKGRFSSASMPVGKHIIKTQINYIKDKNGKLIKKELNMYLDVDFEKMAMLNKKINNAMMHEEGGLNEFSKKSVENQTNT